MKNITIMKREVTINLGNRDEDKDVSRIVATFSVDLDNDQDVGVVYKFLVELNDIKLNVHVNNIHRDIITIFGYYIVESNTIFSLNEYLTEHKIFN